MQKKKKKATSTCEDVAVPANKVSRGIGTVCTWQDTLGACHAPAAAPASQGLSLGLAGGSGSQSGMCCAFSHALVPAVLPVPWLSVWKVKQNGLVCSLWHMCQGLPPSLLMYAFSSLFTLSRCFKPHGLPPLFVIYLMILSNIPESSGVFLFVIVG